MYSISNLLATLGERFGVLAESNTHQLTVIARNADVAVGDLFLLLCRRGPHRFYIFRATQYANVMNRTLEISDVARNKLTMPDSYLAEDLREEQLIELKGMVLGYSEYDPARDCWSFHRPRRLPQHLTDVYLVRHQQPQIAEVIRTLLGAQLGEGLLELAWKIDTGGGDVCVLITPLLLSYQIGEKNEKKPLGSLQEQPGGLGWRRFSTRPWRNWRSSLKFMPPITQWKSHDEFRASDVSATAAERSNPPGRT